MLMRNRPLHGSEIVMAKYRRSIGLCAAGLVLTLGSAPLSGAPGPLFSNAGADPAEPGLSTGTVSASGAPAPVGGQWSELQRDITGANALAGVSMHPGGVAGTYRLADDLTVSGFAYGWSVGSMSFFAYIGDGNASFTGLQVRIWSGMPDAPGSSVVWDSAGTGAALISAPMGVYRAFDSVSLPFTAPEATRPISRLTLTTPGLVLAPGVYWVDWQGTLSDPNASAFSPLVTRTGVRGTAGANARQLISVGGIGQWTGVLDPGKPAASPDVAQELPFLIEGSAAASPCPGDADSSGGINFSDITSTLAHWGASYLPSTGAGDADGNGVVEFADVTAALVAWGGACP